MVYIFGSKSYCVLTGKSVFELLQLLCRCVCIRFQQIVFGNFTRQIKGCSRLIKCEANFLLLYVVNLWQTLVALYSLWWNAGKYTMLEMPFSNLSYWLLGCITLLLILCQNRIFHTKACTCMTFGSKLKLYHMNNNCFLPADQIAFLFKMLTVLIFHSGQ